MNVVDVLTLQGGVARRRELVSGGVSAAQLQRARDDGRVVRLGRGIYALPDADRRLIEAAELGGELACISAAAHRGLWVLRSPRLLHVCLDHGRRTASSVRIHRAARPVTTLLICLQVMRCLPELDALCIVESAVVKRLVSLEELRGSAGGKHDGPLRRIIALIDPHSQSILETAARYPLQEAGLAVQSQVYVKGVGRLDLFVEGVLGIEADGREYHSGATEFEEDRRRWNLLTVGGVPVLRVTRGQVVERPRAYLQQVQRAVLVHQKVRR
ncbi:type IV toxin-antitoxin system AbiEi family antitoxin domain-containing protein [uncultured Arthrobacter sp.]|uniref:type IV toxin-antitoxin system AbiEi family antitoxin domain-containing protein n=1 Tax=uncultured Arthrobacter sp. TaxID=114050 RepID=UPI0026355A01|nr:type IV toxin-antitoxin system AbiEi family antitoxin domain-containing protein [uncultured Arthrobacter sp.]